MAAQLKSIHPGLLHNWVWRCSWVVSSGTKEKHMNNLWIMSLTGRKGPGPSSLLPGTWRQWQPYGEDSTQGMAQQQIEESWAPEVMKPWHQSWVACYMREKCTSFLFKLRLVWGFITAAEPLSYLRQMGFMGLLATPDVLMFKGGWAREPTWLLRWKIRMLPGSIFSPRCQHTPCIQHFTEAAGGCHVDEAQDGNLSKITCAWVTEPTSRLMVSDS